MPVKKLVHIYPYPLGDEGTSPTEVNGLEGLRECFLVRVPFREGARARLTLPSLMSTSHGMSA
jgi:hypothetical protein